MEKQSPAESVEAFTKAFRQVQQRVIEDDHERYGIPLKELEDMMAGGIDSYMAYIEYFIALAAEPDQLHR